ncbi:MULTISPECIES: hypothetical protein [Methanobacterium]|jgi:hypothetical protein|uniref:Uncharacterized protein n=1 Tax=Methanobacterium bryantii TaxID=2161 RepID=A0A2A2H7A3_METBR|nr:MULTISPECIES: hypothetical protein [Methanobacterium]OEC84972.1 hypothetical protein A9507_01180 [Methanobacterium sp. A39]PAV05123.1 hypothetical protein ASJ80_12605 [Methanobacterium bryantii]
MESLIKNYASTHDIEITDYSIHVLDQPENFTARQNNGEELAAQYIVPNVKKSDYKLVIIFHAHQQVMEMVFILQHILWTINQRNLPKMLKKYCLPLNIINLPKTACIKPPS